MSNQHRATYLNDHLAGATAGLELVEHLERAYAGNDLGGVFAGLKADIAADRQELHALMARLSITESHARKAMAWLTEKFSELKLRLDDPGDGTLRLLQAAEALSLGIEGKRLLWRALAKAQEDAAELRGPDYARLQQRAQEQRQRIEAIRTEAARAALGR